MPISSDERPVLDLMRAMDMPTRPAMWSSTDAGETWVWGDFFFTLQKEPITMGEAIARAWEGRSGFSGMTYRYAMHVYYRLDRNPHGPSHRPVLCMGLEQADYSAVPELREMLKTMSTGPTVGDKGPIVLGMFTADSHLNFGEYTGGLDRGSVCQLFLQRLGNQLALEGEPKRIGRLDDAHGHPETGLPPKEKKKGCMAGAVLFFLLSGLAIWGIQS